MSEWISRFKWHLLVFLVGGLLGSIAVFLFGPQRVQNHYTERIIEREIPVVNETVKQTTQTEIVYVPKAMISEEVVNPATGQSQTMQSLEKTDVELKVNQPAVTVKVNDRPYMFDLLSGESQKFELGKITLQQDSVIGIELAVKPQIIDQTKRSGIDFFVGRYSGIGIFHKRVGLDIGTDGKKEDYRLRWRAVEW